ncbi:MAG: CDP-archaeol synthase [Nanoarchaeota archaeon]|nr:CDP-archaeol synthase [Nanoarchaeota archaeon]MBU1269599.1 CDP-archaeol synthase [Nanoarchaeota archaeon]MBU1605057.1 CDP-archaeol synthase [Nanoarchaeota archaeon]MBU2442611.1 CDP-archaeol synthase [Nanoarchaeota archaeon]
MILEALYYFLPAYFANVVPPLFKWLPILDKPIDFDKKFRGKPLFGPNKTIRGFLISCLFGMVIFHIQKLLYNYSFFQKISIINYQEQTIWLGFLLGFGAIFGDLVKSFFKRRIAIPSGKPWIPFDQLDFVIGAFLFSSIIFLPSIDIILIIIILSPFLQLIFHYLGYVLGINKDKI